MTTFAYEPEKARMKVTDSDGFSTTISYDEGGRIFSVENGLGQEIQCQYDAYGRLAAVGTPVPDARPKKSARRRPMSGTDRSEASGFGTIVLLLLAGGIVVFLVAQLRA